MSYCFTFVHAVVVVFHPEWKALYVGLNALNSQVVMVL